MYEDCGQLGSLFFINITRHLVWCTHSECKPHDDAAISQVWHRPFPTCHLCLSTSHAGWKQGAPVSGNSVEGVHRGRNIDSATYKRHNLKLYKPIKFHLFFCAFFRFCDFKAFGRDCTKFFALNDECFRFLALG